ncbi:nitric oxide synthase oxygenase [Saccharothrix australiensis]|uniref:Nitric-oxide synthase n=1 Tax=Saccharothrix australiensis TaxID=2072 RepID=A0A495VST0_9PSEU|nr:nitric oxide synthase oxygenase [Saccharothrix australiensis]RKT51747.1 nitric-oxide synthase [Saccharothrix australiensis]
MHTTESTALDPAAAEGFLRMFHIAHPEAGPVGTRLARVREEIADTGTYRHTASELAYGARVALRDSGWCTSGVPWRRLKVRDLRGCRDAATVAAECVEHLRLATNDGRIRPLVTVFAPDAPARPGPRVWNEQAVRYAGHADGTGDRRYRAFTGAVRAMGWQPPAAPGPFDVLPLVVETEHEGPRLFAVPPEVVHEVSLEHPDLPWFGSLGLRWHAVPLITNMRLSIGGVHYPAAPFNTWFVGSEIGARSLADEHAYGAARPVAEALGLDTSAERSLWRDRAVVELNRAVLHSFDLAGVTVTDHHAESLHRLSWLRSRQRPAGERPAFRLDPAAARRARAGGPARFSGSPVETTRPHSTGRLAELLRRPAEK